MPGASPSDPPMRMLYNLFFTRQFLTHRLMGLAYLVQFSLALFMYYYDFDMFYRSPLVWTLPLSGHLQSIIASLTFTFLPKKQEDPGYYGDKSTLSYNFILENVYFSGLLLFQWLYMHEDYQKLFTEYVPVVPEACFVFLPYFVFRPFFPKTRFRDSLKLQKNKTEKNNSFFIVVTYVTKVFYVWAKHFMGYFLNYARFFDRIGPEQIYHIYLMLIFGSAATTISMFLHTLKFKKYIGPRTAYLWYMFSYLMTFYSWIRIANVFFDNTDLMMYVIFGITINFGPQLPQLLVQAAWMVLFNMQRLGQLPVDVSSKLFLGASAATM